MVVWYVSIIRTSSQRKFPSSSLPFLFHMSLDDTLFFSPKNNDKYEILETLIIQKSRLCLFGYTFFFTRHVPSNSDRERTLVPVAVVVDRQGSLHKLAGGVNLFVAMAVLDVGLSPAVILGRVVFLAAGQFIGPHRRGTLVMRV